MTNEVLVSYSRLTLDNHYKDPNILMQGAGGINFRGIFPSAVSSPYLPTDLLHGWGGNGQVGQLWAKANDMFAHNDALQFSNKLTKLAGAHGLKFGVSVERGQKQQNFENKEAGELWFGPTTPPAPATPPPTCSSAASASSPGHRAHGNP